jgi:hypothetical protein
LPKLSDFRPALTCEAFALSAARSDLSESPRPPREIRPPSVAATRWLGRDAIDERVLGRRLDQLDRSVDIHVSGVRRKLGPRQDGDQRVKSIRSAGYVYTRASFHA